MGSSNGMWSAGRPTIIQCPGLLGDEMGIRDLHASQEVVSASQLGNKIPDFAFVKIQGLTRRDLNRCCQNRGE
jgi:hypothetical protein